MPPLIQPIVLAITAGITDLQPIIITQEGQRCRASIKRNNRRFHEALLSGMPDYRISVDPADENLKELDLELPDQEGDFVNGFDPDSPLWLDREQKRCAEFEQEGESLVLVAPKLGHVWRRLKETSTPLAAALVFMTRRDANFRKFGPEEPVALGELLTTWLRPLCKDPADLRIVEYLQGQEILENLQRNSSLSFLAARRIEAGLRRLHNDHPEAPLMLAVSGGQPAAKEFVTAAARLFFAPEQISSALRTATGTDSGCIVLPGPAEAARVRRLALWHVRHGGFVEAHAVALEFHEDVQAASWVRPLGYTADLINRNLGIRSDPHIAPPKSLKKIVERQKFRCLNHALRTEAALQGRHWPEAINWTMSFFDTILLDAIEKGLPVGAKLNDRNREIIWPSTLKLQPYESLLSGEYPALKPSRRDGYKYDALGHARGKWIDWLNSDELRSLNSATQAGESSPIQYRNINTHNSLTQQELEDACKSFRNSGLWAPQISGPGSAFLNQPVVRAALTWLLGDPDPAGLYRVLVGDLENLLLDPEGKSAQPPATPPGFVVV